MEDVSVESEESIRNKASRMVGMLDRRKEDRLEEVIQKKKKDAERQSKLKSWDYFEQNFRQECESLRTKINRKDVEFHDKSKVADYLEDLSESYEKLLKFLNDSTVLLNSFHLEKTQKILNQFQADISDRKQQLAPKKKFAFKARKKMETVVKDGTSTDTSFARKFNFAQDQCDISNKSGEVLALCGDEINKRDVSLSNLQGCVVELFGYPATVHLNLIKNCIILCGPVSGSIFIDNCTDSRIAAGCQQLRIHNTTETDFYLHVTSRAIIEDTSKVRFAPYNWTYQNVDEEFSKSGLSKELNNWNKVDDFNWLAVDTVSPNWSILPQNERVVEWVELKNSFLQ